MQPILHIIRQIVQRALMCVGSITKTYLPISSTVAILEGVKWDIGKLQLVLERLILLLLMGILQLPTVQRITTILMSLELTG